MTIAEINQLDKDDFTKALIGIYESSPWIPRLAFESVPFRDLSALQGRLRGIVDESGDQKKLDLIQAHPDLGGKLGKKSELTDESRQEQNRLGLDGLEDEEYESFCEMNRAYREKFGFPFIICVGNVDHRSEIISAFEHRLELSEDEEFEEAINQIHEIARLRLEGLINPD